jgi:hypothetical protein
MPERNHDRRVSEPQRGRVEPIGAARIRSGCRRLDPIVGHNGCLKGRRFTGPRRGGRRRESRGRDGQRRDRVRRSVTVGLQFVDGVAPSAENEFPRTQPFHLFSPLKPATTSRRNCSTSTLTNRDVSAESWAVGRSLALQAAYSSVDKLPEELIEVLVLLKPMHGSLRREGQSTGSTPRLASRALVCSGTLDPRIHSVHFGRRRQPFRPRTKSSPQSAQGRYW